jgi:hypothetical protein
VCSFTSPGVCALLRLLVLSRLWGPIEKDKDLRGLPEPRNTPGIDTESSLIPVPVPSHHAPELLKAALNVVVADEQPLDGPEDLTQW